jgi:hypothetical protein
MQLGRQINRKKKMNVDRTITRALLSEHNIQQTLGKALHYPWYKDDQESFPGATEASGVCVGDHVAETLAQEAADKLKQYEKALVDIAPWISASMDDGCCQKYLDACNAILLIANPLYEEFNEFTEEEKEAIRKAAENDTPFFLR